MEEWKAKCEAAKKETVAAAMKNRSLRDLNQDVDAQRFYWETRTKHRVALYGPDVEASLMKESQTVQKCQS